jgi:L-2-hydroxyglutarate oxidase
LREREPHVAGAAALFVPETGIVDFAEVAHAFAAVVREAGGQIRTGARLRRVRRKRGMLQLETSSGQITCRNLINCGGLYSDRIARMCGVDPGLQIIPFRGEYYKLIRHRRHLVRNLVYPVPDPRFPFLGVHFTRTILGEVQAGPNAVLALKREGYHRSSFSPADVLDFLSYRGFWRLTRNYWRTGIGEFRRSLSKRVFTEALRSLVPELGEGDLQSAAAGVRAQAVGPDGRMIDDFRIVHAERTVHVLNAPSPAATAAISIGQHIADLARAHFCDR